MTSPFAAPWPFVVALAACALGGCGGNDHPATYPVTGTVTYRNQPVAGAQVIFQAPGAPLAQGVTDAAGKYSLRSFEPGDGAVAGVHRVAVLKMDLAPGAKADDPYAVKVNVLPAKYARAENSPLQKEVGTGANDIAIDLAD